MKKLNDLLDGLRRELGLPQLQLNGEGCCLLSFDETPVAIELDGETDRCVLSSPVAGIGENRKLGLYELLLERNHFWRGTGGGTLSIDRQSGLVYLLYAFPPEHVSEGQFKTILENFVITAEQIVAAIMEVLGNEEPAEREENPEHAIKA